MPCQFTSRKPELTVRVLDPPCPGHARVARDSLRHVTPMILLVVGGRPRVRARKTPLLWPLPVPATAAQCPRRCDGPQPRTIFPWLSPPPSLFRRHSAKRPPIDRGSHRMSPDLISGRAPTMLLPLNDMR